MLGDILLLRQNTKQRNTPHGYLHMKHSALEKRATAFVNKIIPFFLTESAVLQKVSN